MSKKPRQHLKLIEPPRRPNQAPLKTRTEEFYICDALGCSNVVSIADKHLYSGPIYCILHRERKANA
jgi:hypothetical protein